jgi:hypothetical protein
MDEIIEKGERVLTTKYRKIFQITLWATLFFALLVIGLALLASEAITGTVGAISNPAFLLGTGLIVLAIVARKTGWARDVS